MRYDKNVPTKKNRLLTTSGPRDIQRRQILSAQSDLVDDLKTQVVMLQEQVGKNLSAVSSDGKYTSDQVNEAVINAVKSEVDSLKSKYESRISVLEAENRVLRETLKENNKLLNTRPDVTNNITEEQIQKIISTTVSQISDSKQTEIIEETKRPKIETVFIDPSESGVTNNVEVCITSKEDNSAKENMNDKINKLKGILGSLPKKKQ